MLTSRVPAAVDALLEILRASPALDGVRVVDGPPAVNFTDKHVIYVGWQPGGDTSVNLTQDFASAGARTRDEAFAISCYAETRAGDKDVAARRTRVFELVGAVEVAMRSTDELPEAATLNGTVQWAGMTAGDLVQLQSEGTLAGLAFTVTCRARI